MGFRKGRIYGYTGCLLFMDALCCKKSIKLSTGVCDFAVKCQGPISNKYSSVVSE